METYTFPALQTKEIAHVISQLVGTNIDEKLLLAPIDPQAIQHLYEMILLRLLDLPEGEFAIPTEAADLLSFTQIHQASIPALNFHKKFCSLMEKIHVPFTLKDLFMPTPKSVRSVLSGIINFLRYSEERVANHSAQNNEAEALADQLATLDDELHKHEEELKLLKHQVSQEQPKTEHLLITINQCKEEIKTLYQEQYNYQQILNQKKSRNKELKQTIAQLDGEIEMKKNEVELLKAQIVRSPEKIKKQMLEVEGAFEKEKNMLLAAEQQLAKDDSRFQVTAKITNDIKSCNALLLESWRVMEAINEKKNEVKQLKLEYSEYEQEMRDLTAKQEQLTRRIQSSEESRKRQEAYLTPKIEQARKLANKVVAERQQVEDAKATAIHLLNSNDSGMKEITFKKEQMVAEYEAEISEMQESYELLLVDMCQYRNQLRAVVGH